MKVKDIQILNKRLLVAMLSTVIALLTVTTALGFDFGYKLYIKEDLVGTFSSEQEAYDAAEYISRESKSVLTKSTEVKFFVSEGEKYTTQEEAFENFKAGNPRYEKAYAVCMGDNEAFYVKSLGEAEEIKNEVLASYWEEFAVSCDFVDEFSVKEKYVLKEEISGREEAKEILKSFSVRSVIEKTVREVESFEVIYVDDENLYIGESAISVTGRNGEKDVLYTTIKINGNEIETKITGETVINVKENEVVKIGKKPLPKGEAVGSFMNPAEGVLTSPFGPRWGRMHKGIDIAAPVGTPLYASDGGKVIYAGWMDGYGYLIQIDHKNGYTTYYAHCSRLHVKVGDLVAQGDLVGDMGSTGNSTGSHLHFEVRLNNEPQDPQNYVKY